MSGSEPRGWLRAAADGVTVGVRLAPKARRERIEGIVRDPSGVERVSVAVTAPPAEGAANAALCRVLAKAWRVPRSAIGIAVGAASREKVLHVAGDTAALEARLLEWARMLHER